MKKKNEEHKQEGELKTNKPGRKLRRKHEENTIRKDEQE